MIGKIKNEVAADQGKLALKVMRTNDLMKEKN